MSTVSLRKLAAELAKMDNPRARDEDIVSTQTALAALGRKLRASTAEEANAINATIMAKAGKRMK